jgi:hypothetical protein
MNKSLDIINFAVSPIIKAALIAARFSGRVRKRSLKRLAAMDADTKDKEILFSKSNYWNYAVLQWSDARLTSADVIILCYNS